MLRLDGYIRVSRVGGREGEGYISPSVQREAIQGYAKDLDGQIVAWHDDQDFSGGNLERPAFQAALERIRSDQSDGIVVMKVDRFARSVADGATIVREIVDAGKLFASCHERIDPATPEGKYMLTSFLANAELFLDQAKAGWETAKGRAVARGAHIGPTPIGYLKVDRAPSKPSHISPDQSATLGGPTEPGRLVPSPDVGPAITELFKRAATGQHIDTNLARWFNERAPHPSGRHWQSSEIRRWLRNRVYLGEVRYGDLVNAEAHAPLTDPETWERCQRDPGERMTAHSPFLLAGLVRCASCRYSMGGQTHGGSKGQTPVYRCSGRHGCAEPSVIVAKRLEDYVVGMIRERQRGLVVSGAHAGPDLSAVDKALADAEAELARFVADVTARQLLGEAPWQEGLRVRALDRDAKKDKRDRLYAEQNAEELIHIDLDALDFEGLRDLLKGTVRHVFVRRRRAAVEHRALVIWSDDLDPIDVPGPHRSGPFKPFRWR